MSRNKKGIKLAVSVGLIAFMGFSCAKKPSKVADGSGSMDTVFNKSEFLGTTGDSSALVGQKIFVIGEKTTGPEAEFIDAAVEHDRPEAFSLVTGSPEGLKDGDKVYFQLSTQSSTLYLLRVGDSYPVAQWDGVSFCKIETATNSRGEETRYLRADCQDVKNKDEANFISVSSASVKTRWIEDSSLIATFSKSALFNKPYNINTEEMPASSFIKSAMAKELASKEQGWFSRLTSLFQEPRAYLSGLQQNVIFEQNQDDVIVMLLEGDKDKTPLAQWKISSHCNIVPRRNDWGEATVRAGKECSNEKIVEKSSFAFFSASLEDVAIQYIADGDLDGLYSKDMFSTVYDPKTGGPLEIVEPKFAPINRYKNATKDDLEAYTGRKLLETAMDLEQRAIKEMYSNSLLGYPDGRDLLKFFAVKSTIKDIYEKGQRQVAFLHDGERLAVVVKFEGNEATTYYTARELENRKYSPWEVLATFGANSQCKIESKLNAFGEKEALKVKRCDSGKANSDYQNLLSYPLVNVELGDLEVREVSSEWLKYWRTASVRNSQVTLKLMTGPYTNKGYSGTRAKNLITGDGFNGFNQLRPVKFSLTERFNCSSKVIEEKNDNGEVVKRTVIDPDVSELSRTPFVQRNENEVKDKFQPELFNSDDLINVDLLAEPCSEINVRLKPVSGHILVQKVVPENLVSAQEKTFAEPATDVSGATDLYYVTFAGIPMGLTRIMPNTNDGSVTAINLKGISVADLNEFLLMEFNGKAIDDPAVADNINMLYATVDIKSTQPFSQTEKLDLFDRNFMAEGAEWYYEKTVVDRPFDSLYTSLPFYMELGVQWQGGRVRVHKTKNSVQLVDVNIPIQAIEEAEKDENIGDKMDVMLEIPAHWTQYRVPTTGSDAFLREDELQEGDIAANEWKERPWVMYEFNRADHMSDSRSDVYKLNTLEIGDDYVNFTVYESTTKLTFKYSLSRAKPSRTDGRTYFATDRKKFGYFRNWVNYYPGTTTQYEDVQETFINVARMYPEPDPTNDNKPTITYYITDNSPKDPLLRRAIEKATEAWNIAFGKAAVGTGKTPVAVKLAKETVPLGDVRFNKVAFYGYDRASSLLGYGPSVSDPKSGEIYSATNHIYLRNYREGIWRSLSDYIRSEIGQYEKTKLKNLKGVIPDQKLAISLGMADAQNSGGNNSMSMSDFQRFKQAYAAGQDLSGFNRGAPTSDQLYMSSVQDLDPRFFDLNDLESSRKLFKTPLHALMYNFTQNQSLGKGLAAAANTMVSKFKPKEYAKAVDHDPRLWQQAQQGLCGYTASNYNTIKEIQKLCDNGDSEAPLFFAYMEKIRDAKKKGVEMTHIADEEEKAFTSCSDILLEKKLIATMVHEFGHNFGLTHNFAASTDINNFPRNEEGKPKFLTASVMDYAGNDDDRGDEPGPYDIAAIRYGYYDAIETVNPANGSDVTLVPLKGRKIAEAIAASESPNKILKPYKYCWDYDILDFGQMPLSNPDCRRWDRGTNAVELANDLIDQFNSYMITRSHRYDRNSISDPLNFGYGLMDRTFIPLKILYDYFRFQLNEKTGAKDPYLTNIRNEGELEQLVKSIGDKELSQYYEASKIIYAFLEKLAFSPVNYCVMKNASGAEEFMDFEVLRKQIYYESYQSKGDGTIVNDCSEVKKYVEAGESASLAGYTYVSDVGNVYNDVSWSPKPDETFDRPDIQLGMKHARAAAWLTMTLRFPTSGVASEKSNYTPSMLDQPQLRLNLLAATVLRSAGGEAKANLWDDYKSGIKGSIPAFFVESKLYERAHYLNLAMSYAPDTSTDRASLAKAYYGRAQDIISMFGLPIGSGENEFPTLDDALAAIQQQLNGQQCTDILGQKRTNDIAWMQDANSNYYVAIACNNDLAYILIKSLQNISARAEPYVKDAKEATNKARQIFALVQSMDTAYRKVLATPPAEGQTVPTFPEFFQVFMQPTLASGKFSQTDFDVLLTFILDVLGMGGPTPAYNIGVDDPAKLNSFAKPLVQVIMPYVDSWLDYQKNQVEYNAQEELLRSMIFASNPSNLGYGLSQYLDVLGIITGGGTTVDSYSGPKPALLHDIGALAHRGSSPSALFDAAVLKVQAQGLTLQ